MSEKRVNIALKEEIHAKAKIISILKGISFGEYLEMCVEKGMEQDKKILEQVKFKK